jgi:hypothetical protein
MILDKHPACVPTDFINVEHVRSHFGVKVGPEITSAHVTSPEFWKHVRVPIQVNDLIEVVGPKLDMLLRVTVAGDGLILTRTLRHWEETRAEAKAATATKGKIGFIPGKGYRALGEDGTEIASGLSTKAEAEAALTKAVA